MVYTDTHCHIYSEQFDEDINDTIKRAIDAGVQRFLLPAIDSNYSVKMNVLANQHSFIYPMYGLHPCSVNSEVEAELKHVKSQLFDNSDLKKPVAVGEIGIDLYWDKTYLKEQKDALKTQITWAKELNLPIVIHVRDAFDEVFEVIDALNDENLSGVFHCFTGNIEQAKHIIDYGRFKLGIGGVLTFKNAGLDKVIEDVSLEHLVLETDSPYLAPHPHRGKRNEPSYLKLIARKLAETKGVLPEEVAQITERNTNEIFFPNQL